MNALAQKYRILNKKGEGTFSEVLRCQLKEDGSYWACKRMKQRYDSLEQVNNLREVQALRRLNPHPNVLHLEEVLFDKKSGVLVLVCELMDMNVYEMIRGKQKYLPEAKVKSYMYQLVKAIGHMHRLGIFHRDVKPENVLVKDSVLKLADFGSCRSIYSKQPYTEYISTRWYRAPECLLTDGFYNFKMDIWSVGCVFFEVLSLHPLFPGANEVDQIAKIHDVLGTPDSRIIDKLQNKTRGINFSFPPKKGTGIEKMLSHASTGSIDVINRMLSYDSEERPTAKQILRHPYFKDMWDAEKAATAAAVAAARESGEGGTVAPHENGFTKGGDEDKQSDKPATKLPRVDGGGGAMSVKEYLKQQPLFQPSKKKKRGYKNLLSTVPEAKRTPLSTTTFPDNTFPQPLPKIQSTAILPSIADTFVRKSKVHSTARTLASHFHLPSIEK